MKTPKILKYLILFFLLGATYALVEFIYRSIMDPGTVNPTQTIVMWIIGGVASIGMGYINEIKRFRKTKMFIQAIIAAIIILTVEFFSGVFVNKILLLNIWDYSELPLNIYGQISLFFGIAWFAIAPFGIWLDDHLRFKIFKEESCGSLFSYYKNLVVLK